jgi:hypothetical protein
MSSNSSKVWDKLQQCSKASCSKYDKQKEKARAQTTLKLPKIQGMMTKDYKQWIVQADKIMEEESKMLNERYACIVKQCRKEFQDFIKNDIKSQTEYLTGLENEAKSNTNKSASKSINIRIKKAQNDLKMLNDILTAEVSNTNRSFLGSIIRHF